MPTSSIKNWLVACICMVLLCAFPPTAKSLVQGDNLGEYIVDDRLADRQTIWYRIRNDTRLRLPRLNKRIEHEIKRYQRNPRYFKKLMTRSAPYIYYVTQELQKSGLPLDLALLPVVESGYDPFAFSSGVARGMWQFIAPTARVYGLEMHASYDGRRDLVASTDAAIRFLKDLNRYADGNWPHALAAYNAGWATVLKQINRNKRRGRSTEFWDLKLPKETSNYVPRFYAIAHIIHNPKKFKVSLPAIPNRRALYISHDLEAQINLAHAAELASLSPKVLYKLNAGFKTGVTPPMGPHRIVVPAAHQRVFTEAVRALTNEELIRWRAHTVKPGDSISQLASESNTTIDAIVRANNLENPDYIRANTNIIIPASIYPTNPSQNSRRRNIYSKKSGRITSGETKHKHVVQKKETLWSIARDYDIQDYKKIAEWNDISDKSVLHPGQTLTLFVPEGQVVALPTEREPVFRKVIYTVRRGDSLARIAKRFSVSSESLRKWNDLKKGAAIHPGQKVTLHIDAAGN